MRTIFQTLILSLLFLSIANLISTKNWVETDQKDFINEPNNLKQAGFWNNFTFLHITNLNWTIANETDWCSGSGTWDDPFLIENMVINASDSPIGYGIFIENSINDYFKIENVTIFEATDGIRLENTNNGDLINNTLSDNIGSGISMVNCVNNTISRNNLINNEWSGINLTSNCMNNRIIGNTAINDGSTMQDNGIYLGNYCDNNYIMGNLIYDNRFYGINIIDHCEENIIFNNTIQNFATNQQWYGIYIQNYCHQNTISLNLFEDLNYGICLVSSDQNTVTDNYFVECGTGMWMVINYQTNITGNTISGGSTGFLFSACDEGEIVNNFINNTANCAIRIMINCDNNEFYENIIKDNINLGIQLDSPSDTNNKVYKNSFISNKIHAYDNGTATYWNNSVVGNYWDNYTGLDSDNNHIGDTPYNISGAANASDSLPIYDHGAPTITINTPSSSSYDTDAPEFNIFINDPFIYLMWYTINNSGTRYYFTGNGTINEDVWDLLIDGNLVINFYVRDIAWNVGSNSVDVIKGTSESPVDGPNDGPLDLDLIPIIIISLIAISAIIIAGILIRKKSNKEKIQTSKILNKEQSTQAQYIDDVKNILTIIAIHKESGLALSKIALHGGIGLDENLFTGFISAMGSFKNELAKQMGLRVREEGGDNVIQYNEFTITIMDGEYLRLGLVSHNSLGTSIKQQCGQILRNYELKHINNLKNFDGEIQVFKDFEEIVKSEVIDHLTNNSHKNFH
jgi:parallel beta-helix repeat protein